MLPYFIRGRNFGPLIVPSLCLTTRNTEHAKNNILFWRYLSMVSEYFNNAMGVDKETLAIVTKQTLSRMGKGGAKSEDESSQRTDRKLSVIMRTRAELQLCIAKLLSSCCELNRWPY